MNGWEFFTDFSDQGDAGIAVHSGDFDGGFHKVFGKKLVGNVNFGTKHAHWACNEKVFGWGEWPDGVFARF